MADSKNTPKHTNRNNRKNKRIPVLIKIENWPIPELKNHAICAHNISIGGMMLEIIPPVKDDAKIQVNDLIMVSCLLPTQKDYLNISSQIVWKKPLVKNNTGIESTQIGVRYAVMSDIMEMVINDYLEREASNNSKA